MKKYVSVTVEQVQECAYCDYNCDFEGIGYCKWGQIEIWSCPSHGRFEMVNGPLRWKGQQIR